jgi:phosphate transport system substrate-binding protein
MKKQTIKKAGLAFALVVALAAGMTGCGGGSTDSTSSSDTNASKFDATSKITVVSREDGSGTRGAFVELTGVQTKAADGTKTDNTTAEASVVNNTDVMLTSVAGDPYAIGYVSLGSLNDSVKAISVDGIAASTATIKDGTYPISRPFQIATKGAPSALAQDLINYILSAEGQKVVADGYVTIDDNAPAFTSKMPAGKLVVAGSSSVSPLMEKLVEAYQLINKNADIEIQTSDSTTGMTAAINGTCDIGMASRDLSDTELKSLTPVTIAKDGIAVIVNPANTTTNLSKDQIKAIFTGKTTTWDAL